jgi:hypothetical protein
MNERHELISHLEQLAAILRASKDALHRDVLTSVSGYLRRRLDAMPGAAVPSVVRAVSPH